jgi:hypothetical protein
MEAAARLENEFKVLRIAACNAEPTSYGASDKEWIDRADNQSLDEKVPDDVCREAVVGAIRNNLRVSAKRVAAR